MKSKQFHFSVRIYYEDTDHAGAVYHPNFLNYFERAREEALGVENLAALWREQGFGFVVYKVEVTFQDAVSYGETLDIRSSYVLDGEYRVNWRQEAWRENAERPAVIAMVQNVCLDRSKQLCRIPFLESLKASVETR